MIDRHVGRAAPTYNLSANPEKYIGIIKNHGELARIMQSRVCPCVTPDGSPSMYCQICNGDGYIYSFQRRLLSADEDSIVSPDGKTIYPFRIPVMDPVSVQKLREPECGGIVDYKIDSFTDDEIRISERNPKPGDPNLPQHYEQLRITYFFDRYTRVIGEKPLVIPALNSLVLSGTKYDDSYKSSNPLNIHGDVAIVTRIHSIANNHDYASFTFRKNIIYVNVGVTEPPLVPGDIEVDYYFCPPTEVLPGDKISMVEKGNKWSSDLALGETRMMFQPWYNIARGDIITMYSMIIYTHEVIVHNTGVDKLREFDVNNIEDMIIDEDNHYYYLGTDYILQNFRDLKWIGDQPAQGKRLSARYGYNPTYIVFEDNPQPNTLENRMYPTTCNVKIWSKTLNRDIIRAVQLNA